MSTRCHVATRKGLFTLERGGSAWEVTRVSFLGDNCTLVMHDPRNGDLIAALAHGHFGAKMHRSRDGGATWSEIATPVYPEKPADYVPKTTPAEGKPVDWSLKLVWALVTRRRRPARRRVVRHAPGRPVQIRRQRRLVGAESRAVVRAAARRVVWRRRRPPGDSLGVRRSARQPARARRRVVRRRLAHA